MLLVVGLVVVEETERPMTILSQHHSNAPDPRGILSIRQAFILGILLLVPFFAAWNFGQGAANNIIRASEPAEEPDPYWQ